MSRTPLKSFAEKYKRASTILKLLGVWKFEDETIFLSFYRFIVRSLNWTIAVFILGGMLYSAVHNHDQMGIVADSIGLFVPIFMPVFKNIKFYINRENIQNLVREVGEPVKKLTFSSDLGVLIHLREMMAYLTMDFRMFCFGLMSATISVLFIQLLLNRGGLPLPGYFPYNYTATPMYELTILGQAWTMLLTCICLLASDTVMLGILRWAIFQFRILRNNYECCTVEKHPRSGFEMSDEAFNIVAKYNFFKIDDKYREIKSFVLFNEEELKMKDSYIVRFKLCIFHHQRLSALINKFNDIFGKILFAEIFSHCTLICLYLFQIADSLHNRLECLRQCLTLVAGFSHILYLCIFGNLLISQTEILIEHIWSSEWEDLPKQEVKDLMINGQTLAIKPLKVQCGFIFDLTLGTLLWICQKAYSIFAVLQTRSTN